MKRLLAVLAASIGCLLLPSLSVASAPDYPGLDPIKVAQIERLGAIANAQPAQPYPLTLLNADLVAAEWEFEILPWFQREGITDKYGPRIPQQIIWFFEPAGALAESLSQHLLGATDCSVRFVAQSQTSGEAMLITGPVWLNGRYLNPVSPWYREASFVSTLVHELGHDQGICAGPSAYVESSTQIVSLEVMAAMVDGGVPNVVPALLDEYLRITEGALEYEAVRDGALDQYNQLVGDVFGPLRRSQTEKSERDYLFGSAAQRREWMGIRYRYEYLPYLKVAWGLERGSIPAARRARPSAARVMIPSGKALRLDDLGYYLTHAEELSL